MGKLMAGTTPLAAILNQIDDMSGDLTIYVADTSQLLPTTNAVVLEAPTGDTAPSDMRYLIEVSLAREVIRVWSHWRGGRTPTSDDMVKAVIYYAQNDAYMPTE